MLIVEELFLFLSEFRTRAFYLGLSMQRPTSELARANSFFRHQDS